MGQFLHDGKFGCFASYFFKKYSAGQRWSTSVGFFAICLVAQGNRKLANDDEGALVRPNLMRQLVLVLRLVMMMKIITIVTIITIITNITIGLLTAALVLLLLL